MGYASMLEDIRDRLAEGLANIARELEQFEKDYASDNSSFVHLDQLNKLKTVHRQCDALLSEVEDLLEIATAPDLDVAHELVSLRNQMPYLAMRSEKLDEERKLRLIAEKRANDLEEELYKRKQRKHYIKGNPAKKQKALKR
jgi:hypothetical protein